MLELSIEKFPEFAISIFPSSNIPVLALLFF